MSKHERITTPPPDPPADSVPRYLASGWISANDDYRIIDYGEFEFSWRHFAFFWIVVEIIALSLMIFAAFSTR